VKVQPFLRCASRIAALCKPISIRCILLIIVAPTFAVTIRGNLQLQLVTCRLRKDNNRLLEVCTDLHHKCPNFQVVCLQVNEDGNVLLEEFVAPEEKVTDFRTKVSGIRPADLRNAISFDDAMRRTHAILAGRTVIGHALHNDFKVSFS
jgi:DNA polymerase III epsilon subunit-like protein